MNRYVIAAVAIIAVLLGSYLIRSRSSKTLPDGKLSQVTTANADATATANLNARPQVTFSTSKGNFTLELRPDVAPKTVANFLAKWANNECDGLKFHRVEDWVVQGCDPLGNGTGGNTTLPTEVSTENFTVGSVGVARKSTPKELSNDSQIFIVTKDSPFLNNEYTYFGKVVSGMDVVSKIAVGDTILTTNILTK